MFGHDIFLNGLIIEGRPKYIKDLIVFFYMQKVRPSIIARNCTKSIDSIGENHFFPSPPLCLIFLGPEYNFLKTSNHVLLGNGLIIEGPILATLHPNNSTPNTKKRRPVGFEPPTLRGPRFEPHTPPPLFLHLLTHQTPNMPHIVAKSQTRSGR